MPFPTETVKRHASLFSEQPCPTQAPLRQDPGEIWPAALVGGGRRAPRGLGAAVLHYCFLCAPPPQALPVFGVRDAAPGAPGVNTGGLCAARLVDAHTGNTVVTSLLVLVPNAKVIFAPEGSGVIVIINIHK